MAHRAAGHRDENAVNTGRGTGAEVQSSNFKAQEKFPDSRFQRDSALGCSLELRASEIFFPRDRIAAACQIFRVLQFSPKRETRVIPPRR